MRTLFAVILAGVASWFASGALAGGHETNGPSTQALGAERQANVPALHTAAQDDLTWLVGRWLCVSRQYLNRHHLAAAVGDSLLEYLNVYLPYSDEQLTLRLTDNPDDRPIAAEFLVRHVNDIGGFREQLVPMFEAGPVRIGKDRIWYGSPMSEDFNFRYSIEKRDGRIWLILESRAMHFELIKLFSDVGNISQSFVTAPVKGYSPERIQELKHRYEDLVRKLRSASPSIGP